MLEGHISQKLLIDFQIAFPTILIKKKILNNFLFNERYKIVGDRDLIMRISLKEKFCCINTPLATYRIHSNNFFWKKINYWRSKNYSTGLKNLKRKIKKSIISMKLYLKNLKNKLKIKKKFIY